MINNLPTIYEVVTGTAKKQLKEKNPNSSSKSNKSGSKKVAHAPFSFCIIFSLEYSSLPSLGIVFSAVQ